MARGSLLINLTMAILLSKCNDNGRLTRDWVSFVGKTSPRSKWVPVSKLISIRLRRGSSRPPFSRFYAFNRGEWTRNEIRRSLVAFDVSPRSLWLELRWICLTGRKRFNSVSWGSWNRREDRWVFLNWFGSTFNGIETRRRNKDRAKVYLVNPGDCLTLELPIVNTKLFLPKPVKMIGL